MQNQLHLAANTAVSSGGEGLAAIRYAESLALAGCNVTLLSKNFSSANNDVGYVKGSFSLELSPLRTNILQEIFVQYLFIKKLCEQRNIQVIHLHGMWSPFLAVAALVAWRWGIPLVISPHGCLEPWALGYKHRKKWLALKLYQGAILRSASLFVATANQELESIRQLRIRQAVAVIPNGVDIEQSVRRVDSNKTVKIILFLSRVNPKKGLHDLVEAWSVVRQPGWKIVIAGGDEEGYRAKLESLIRTKELEAEFEFVGFVDGVRKQDCFDKADIFILPTYSENFGIAVAEALANELPVITTTGAPWQVLLDNDCGWWVAPGVEGISSALIEAMMCETSELREMGRRGHQLVKDKFSWDNIGVTALEVSEWLLDNSLPKPLVVNQSRAKTDR